YLALLAALEHRPRAAARIAGHAAVRRGAGLIGAENEARARARAQRIAQEALGDAEVERLMAEGALLHSEDIPALAFATADMA
ncbi:MAG TPA: hypothetical protein VJO99_03470, partial [Burkholderiaceae bacterium]|nr:hypothetical protein [Burkholderiaceae bacterium]